MNTAAEAVDLFAGIDHAERAYQEREPDVLAFLPEDDRFDRLRREAEGLLQRFPAADQRTPLFGKLVGVKDIFRVDGFPTRAGSRLPADVFNGPQAGSVTRLQSAGALVMGKTVTTEFAYFAPGPTRNPRHRGHTPGGSSSGSAAAVAAGLCATSLGTQTIGSIIRPAAFCGVVGFKPGYGRIPTDGVIPLSPSLDHVGFFAADVASARAVAAVLCAHWAPQHVGTGRPILGVPEGPYLNSTSASGLANFDRVLRALQAAGYELRRVAVMSDFAQVRARNQLILAAEAARVHVDWFARYGHLYAERTAQLVREGQSITDIQLAAALEERARWRASILQVMEQNAVDVWISPSAPGTAPKGLDSTGDPVMNLPWTQAGLPTLGLPSGNDSKGLPFGLQITGREGADEALLAWAADMEGILAEA